MANNIKEYEYAANRYKELGVDAGDAIELLECIPVSIHCWQLDDVAGFEVKEAQASGGGILSTGDYPGKARNEEEFFADLEKVLTLIPGKIKINIHAIYGDFKGKKVDRDEILPQHFDKWINWAKKNNVGLDFNPSLFGHPMADGSYTLASSDPKVRDFWIENVKRSR
jgi:L-rhamnose isomerase